jgi:acyl transferase domain-containing protein
MATDADIRQADIAVIGLSGLFAGCRDKDALWETIVAKQDHVRDAPDSWAKPWYDPDAPIELGSSSINVRKVALIGDLAVFDPLEFGISPKGVEGDPAHFLALRLASDALKDANYHTRSFDRERTGIIAGHGTNPNRGDIAGFQYGLGIDQTLRILAQVLPNLTPDDLELAREGLKSSLTNLELELLPSLVSNVITGRIANRLDLMGPNYMVDAACASSLIAADLGMRDLREGRSDMMVVGGVQASMPAQIYMLFNQLGALSHGDIRPFDAAAGGTLLGEGVGFAVLKRLPDAIRDGDRIYSVIKGIGISSDGKAFGLLAPRQEGQILAIRRAYAQTGLDPSSIGLIEAHGTGIPLGDRTEIGALRTIFGGRRGKVPTCAIGSIKSMIGHCIPAAGIASLIKTSLALYHKTLPPTLCGNVSQELGIEDTPFYVNTETRPWVHGGDLPRRAGINAFGFGGINAHAILEEYREPVAIPPANVGRWILRRDLEEGGPEAAPPATQQSWRRWPSELFVLAGDSREAVLARVAELVSELKPDTDLAALSRRLYLAAEGDVRLAVVSGSIEDLRDKLALVNEKLPGWKKAAMSSKKGVYYSEMPRRDGKIAFMFSSEGSQYSNMLMDLSLYFPKVRGWFDFLDDVFPRSPRPSAAIFPPPTCIADAVREDLAEQLYAGDLATESTSTASQALYEVLRDLGISCDIMIGHSAGEHVALRASGGCFAPTMDRLKVEMRGLNKVYERLQAEAQISVATTVSVGPVSTETVDGLLRELEGSLHLVADNCQNQVILYAENDVVPQLVERLKALGTIYSMLPLERAYHTPLFRSGVQALRRYYEAELMTGPASIPVMSCSTVEVYPDDPAAALDVAAEQWERPVRFREAISKLYADGVRVFVEVGAGNSLVAFVDNILKGEQYLAVASNIRGKPALEQFQNMLAQLFVAKTPMDLRPVWDRRDLQPDKVQPTSAKRPSFPVVLKAELPMITFAPSVAEELARRGSTATAASVGPALQAHLQPQLSHPAAGVTPLAGGSSLDREEILNRHFELMQEFLGNQARVASLLGDHLKGRLD